MAAGATAPSPRGNESFWRPANLKWLVLLVLGGGALVVAFLAIHGGSKADVSLKVPHGPTLTIKSVADARVAPAAADALDPKIHFVDSALGFAYRKPHGSAWTSTRASGLAAVLHAKGVGGVSIGSPSLPFERMVFAVDWLRVSAGRTLRLSFTSATTAQVLGQTVPADELKSMFGSGIDFVDAIEVSVFDKRLLKDTPVSLPNFYSAVVSTLGISLNKLVADTDKGTILGSFSLRLKGARINGKPSDLNIDRVFRFTESDRRFYVVEAAYSSQTDEPLERWNAMVEVVKSFRVIDAS